MTMDTSKKLTLDDTFRFACYKGIECFNKCCSNLTLFLTPYDIIRIKNRLGLTSTEFLEKYTTCQIGDSSGLPVVFLKMKEDSSCPFVTEEGCSIYSDRPGSCRLYPLARMRSKKEEYYYIVRENHCKGFEEETEWSVREWLEEQGAEIYNEMNDLFMEVLASRMKCPERQFTDKELKMFYMACYNIDRFKDFVSQTSFLDYFDIDEGIVNASDEELMKLAIKWVRFSIFREKTLKLRSSI